VRAPLAKATKAHAAPMRLKSVRSASGKGMPGFARSRFARYARCALTGASAAPCLQRSGASLTHSAKQRTRRQAHATNQSSKAQLPRSADTVCGGRTGFHFRVRGARAFRKRTQINGFKVPSRLYVTERAKQSSTHEYTLRRRGLTANELVTRLRASPGLA
jgi:hypothetical protein